MLLKQNFFPLKESIVHETTELDDEFVLKHIVKTLPKESIIKCFPFKHGRQSIVSLWSIDDLYCSRLNLNK